MGETPETPDTPENPEKGHLGATAGKGNPGRRNARPVVAAMLAVGSTQPAAARKGNVSVRTVKLWLTDPAFVALVEKYRSRMLDRALGKLESGMKDAAATLTKLAKDAALDADRIRAAVQVVQLALKVRDQHTLAAKLDEALRTLRGATDGDPGTGGPGGGSGPDASKPPG